MKLSRTRGNYLRTKLLTMTVVAVACVLFLWQGAAQAATMPLASAQVPDQLASWFATLVQLVTLALPLTGVAGGLQGLLDGMPDVTVWKWTIKGGVLVVLFVALLGTVAANLLGWVEPPTAYPDPQSWLAAQYALIASSMVLLYTQGGLRVKPTNPVPVDVTVVPAVLAPGQTSVTKSA